MKLLFLLSLATYLFGALNENIHSSATLYYEQKDYDNSKQKQDANVLGVGVDIHHDKSAYKVIYEQGGANTIKPALPYDLEFQKLYTQYAYSFTKEIAINLNYITILSDNIALTDGGDVYGVGISYQIEKKILMHFTQYHSIYADFNVEQSDLHLDYNTKFSDLKVKLSFLLKHIIIDEKRKNSFTKNAQDSYTTPGLRAHLAYKTYHLGAGAFFGKRAFSIMNDGFKIQHHAMEFDRTYAIGLGKTISSFVFRVQYIYQRATELPISNENVEIKNLRFITNYKF